MQAQSNVELEQQQNHRRQSESGASAMHQLAEAHQRISDLEQGVQQGSAVIASLQGRLASAQEETKLMLQEAAQRWSQEEILLQGQIQGLREELSAASLQRDLLEGDQSLKSSVVPDGRPSGHGEELSSLKEAVQQYQAKLSAQTIELEELKQKYKQQQQQLSRPPAYSEAVFEAEKSQSITQAASDRREMDLHCQLAAAKAEKYEAEQCQARLEADLTHQLGQARAMLSAKEVQLAEATGRCVSAFMRGFDCFIVGLKYSVPNIVTCT